MNHPAPIQNSPESQSPPTGGLGRFQEEYFYIKCRHTLPDGSCVDGDPPGDYRLYPLRSWELAGVLEWYAHFMAAKGDGCPFAVESVEDAESGFRSLAVTCKVSGESWYFYSSFGGLGAPCGLYTFSGHIANWASNAGRDLENLGEFVSQHAANGRPMTIFEASQEMDALCDALHADGIPFVRRWVKSSSGKVTHVENIEDVNAEMVSARYSENTTLVIGYAPIEKRASEPLKERG